MLQCYNHSVSTIIVWHPWYFPPQYSDVVSVLNCILSKLLFFFLFLQITSANCMTLNCQLEVDKTFSTYTLAWTQKRKCFSYFVNFELIADRWVRHFSSSKLSIKNKSKRWHFCLLERIDSIRGWVHSDMNVQYVNATDAKCILISMWKWTALGVWFIYSFPPVSSLIILSLCLLNLANLNSLELWRKTYGNIWYLCATPTKTYIHTNSKCPVNY